MSLAPLYISNVTFTVSPGKGAVRHDFTCICPEEFQAEARSLSPSSCKELSLLRDAAYRPRSAGPWWWCWGCWRWRSASSWERPTWATALDLVVLDQKRCAHWLGCLHHYPSSWPIYRQASKAVSGSKFSYRQVSVPPPALRRHNVADSMPQWTFLHNVRHRPPALRRDSHKAFSDQSKTSLTCNHWAQTLGTCL